MRGSSSIRKSNFLTATVSELSAVCKPTIVYVAPGLPFPLTSGSAIRNFSLLRAYARWANVRLVFPYGDEQRLRASAPLAPYCESLHPVAAPPVEDGLRRIFGWRPLVVRSGVSDQARRVVEDLAATADLVHVGRLAMVPQVEELLRRGRGRPPLVLDLDDVETLTTFRRYQFTNFPSLGSRAFRYYDLLRLWRYQRWTLRRFDALLVCSEGDRRRLASPNVFIVPNGADVPESRPAVESDGKTLLFCGLLSYDSNVDGIVHFARSILPLVRRQIPDVRLVLVGRTPHAKIQALHDGASIVVKGDVPSVAEHYKSSTVAIVPLRFGGGTRVKILEAWSLGVPVVSTSLGCEGIEGVHGEHLLVADDPDLFAQACVDLLRSPSLREELAARAWALVDRQYRWEATAGRAVSVARRLIDARRSAGQTSR